MASEPIVLSGAAPGSRSTRIRAFIRSHAFLLLLLAGQYVLIQVLTGPLYGDAPRNLHWGLLAVEQPGFLLNEPDLYPQIKGFAPERPDLAPMGLYNAGTGPLHPWWGPVAPMLFGIVWVLTHSYTLLQLVVPLAGAGVVLLTYLLARDLLDSRTALIAAAFTACFPLFREYASTSYTEALSTLAITAALLAYMRGNTVTTILLGGLAALSKLDVIVLYFGTVGMCAMYTIVTQRKGHMDGRQWFHQVAALAGPALIGAPWVWMHHLGGGAGGPTRGLSGELFLFLMPQMLELLFYIPWYGALITLAAIIGCCVLAIRLRVLPDVALVLLLSWLGLGMIVLLVYAATPGAGNSPRVILPALPALAVLFAAGFVRLAGAWRRRIRFYLVVLFSLINLISIGYYGVQGWELRGYAPVWETLRMQPRGFVLTEKYWETILYARQPATWFEGDPEFQKNIMQNGTNFAWYVEHHPIRYVVIPARGSLASADVREYLQSHAQPIIAGRYIVYILPE